MTQRSVTHSTFVIERTHDASPARVFATFAQPEEGSLVYDSRRVEPR